MKDAKGHGSDKRSASSVAFHGTKHAYPVVAHSKLALD